MDYVTFGLVFIIVYFIVRAISISFLQQKMRRKMFEQAYSQVINSPQFKVRNKYE